MAYQALYRKYRPKNFDDFIDQDNVKRILINSIKNGKISHAYLFAGPRGIGKTSMAKIFAKAVNCLDFDKHDDVCDKCENCLECNDNSIDIIEIDAASNNGVDQIRDLKNKIIGKGHNKSNKISVSNHAEINAINEAINYIKDWRLNDCEMYVTLEPCPMCAGAILKSRIKKVYIGTSSNIKSNKKIIDSIFNNNDYYHNVSHQCLLMI